MQPSLTFWRAFWKSAVPMIAGLAEVVGLFIIITSLIKASYHYVRATFFNDHHDFHHDFHHEMSSGLTTALEFLMSAEIAKTFLCKIWNPSCRWRYLRAARHDEPDAGEMEGGHRPAKMRKTAGEEKKRNTGKNSCQTFCRAGDIDVVKNVKP